MMCICKTFSFGAFSSDVTSKTTMVRVAWIFTDVSVLNSQPRDRTGRSCRDDTLSVKM